MTRQEPRYKLRKTGKTAILGGNPLPLADRDDFRVSYRVTAVVVAAISLLVYIRTITPGMEMGDGTELATAASVMGVPHPTGYPLYMIIAKLWLIATLGGEVILRLSLLNGIFMAVSAGITTLIAGGIVDALAPQSRAKTRILQATTAGLVVAFLRYHWKNAVVTEVYAFEFFLTTWFSWLILKAATTGISRNILIWSAVIVGAGVAHHRLSIILFLPFAWLWFKAWQDRRRGISDASRRLPWIPAVAALVIGVALYGWLPFRASRHPSLNWGNTVSVERLYNHVKGSEYLSESLMRPGLDESYSSALLSSFIDGQTAGLVMSFSAQFTPISLQYRQVPGLNRLLMVTTPSGVTLFLLLFVVGLSGAWRLFRILPFWLFACGLMAAQNLVITYLYNIPDIEDYYLYQFWFGWMLIFSAMAAAIARKPEQARLPLAYASLVIPMLVVAGNWRTDDHSNDNSAEILSAAILPDNHDVIPENSILITGSDTDTFTTWYRQMVRHDRTDVLCFAGNFIWKPWYEAFFTDGQKQKYHLTFAPHVARDPAEYARQLSTGVIEPNLLTSPVFTSIQDRPALAELRKLYKFDPVNAAVFPIEDEETTVVLFKISPLDAETTR